MSASSSGLDDSLLFFSISLKRRANGFRFFAAAKVLNSLGYRHARRRMAAPVRPQLDVLQIRLKHPHLPRQVKAHWGCCFKAGSHFGQFFWRDGADTTSTARAFDVLFGLVVLAWLLQWSWQWCDSRTAPGRQSVRPDMRTALRQRRRWLASAVPFVLVSGKPF